MYTSMHNAQEHAHSKQYANFIRFCEHTSAITDSFIPSQNEPKRKKKKKQPCELCLAKEQLKMYESVIVDNLTNMKVKEMENDIRRNVYSYKASYQEAILKSMITMIQFAFVLISAIKINIHSSSIFHSFTILKQLYLVT